jgi:hypothetical protein
MSNPRVNGHCPACGQAQLFMDYATADLRCGGNGCPRRTAAAEILSDPETEHVVVFSDQGGFTIRHPLRERLDDELMSCPLHEWLRFHRPREADRPGMYRATDYRDHWLFVADDVRTDVEGLRPGTQIKG